MLDKSLYHNLSVDVSNLQRKSEKMVRELKKERYNGE
jgi:hypothetical protein|tara:strand:- start:427 stop:537 length:111 start_codon:yes stop_codon:yes gene_type:complete